MFERLRCVPLFRQMVLSTRRALDGVRHALGSQRAILREFGLRLPVLMYHNIGTLVPGSHPDLTVSSRKFNRHMQWIRRHGYNPITAAQWVAWRHEGKILPKKPVLLTFDDAYRQMAKEALPVLRKLGFTATVFVVTSQIGGTNVWDQAKGFVKQDLMSAEEILFWAEQGIEFGAHTRTHPDLCSRDSSEVTAEMIASRDELSKLVKRPVVAFAYPYGRYDESVVGCARGVFSIAFTTDRGINDNRTDLLRLKRGTVCPAYSFADPFFHLVIGYNPFIAVRMKLGCWRRAIRA